MPRRPSVSPRNGVPTPPGFEAHPERINRNAAQWKKEDSARYKLEKMMQMTAEELQKVLNDPDAPYFERKLAEAINKSDWKVIDGMINQVYGYPKQPTEETIDLKPSAIEIKVLQPKKKGKNAKKTEKDL